MSGRAVTGVICTRPVSGYFLLVQIRILSLIPDLLSKMASGDVQKFPLQVERVELERPQLHLKRQWSWQNQAFALF